MEEYKSELSVRVIPGNPFFRFSFGKAEMEAPLPEERKEVEKVLIKNDLIPFARERCGALEHIYFYGETDKIKNACRELKSTLLCGVVHRDEIGSVGCYPEKLER